MTIDSAGSAPAQPVTPAAPVKTPFQRMAGVFFAPEETFTDIARKPDFVWPLIVLTLIAFVIGIVMTQHTDFGAVAAQQAEMVKKKNPNVSDADLERMERFTKASGKVSGFVAPIFMIIGYLVIAVVLWGAFRLMGGDGDFKQALSVTLYSYLPRMLLGGIIGVAVVLMRGGLFDPMQAATLVKTNPAFLVDYKEQPMLFALLASLDVFVIWTLFLLTVGFSKVARVSKAKAATIIIALWLVTVVVRVGFTALTSAMQG